MAALATARDLLTDRLRFLSRGAHLRKNIVVNVSVPPPNEADADDEEDQEDDEEEMSESKATAAALSSTSESTSSSTGTAMQELDEEQLSQYVDWSAWRPQPLAEHFEDEQMLSSAQMSNHARNAIVYRMGACVV